MSPIKHLADVNFVEAFQFMAFYKGNTKDENVISVWKRKTPDVVVFTCAESMSFEHEYLLWIGFDPETQIKELTYYSSFNGLQQYDPGTIQGNFIHLLKKIPHEAVYDALLTNNEVAIYMRNNGYLKEEVK